MAIPRDPALPEFLQSLPCAYADDFAVALMPASSPAFKAVDSCRWPEP